MLRLTDEERAAIVWDLGVTPTLRQIPRVVVCVNPFARHPLPENAFNGPYDERWALLDGALTRVHAGSQLSDVDADPFAS